MEAGENLSLNKVIKRISQTDAQVVLLEHHPGFFALTDSLCIELETLQNQAKVVILELHSTIPLLQEFKPSERTINLLGKLDRIIVHKPEDLNNLLTLGLVNNVMLLPLGVATGPVDIEPSRTRFELGIPEDSLVLSCFGFALPHKGIDTLVEIIKPLSFACGRNVYLLAVNSILDERSDHYIDECQALAQKLGVSDSVRFISDYLPIEVAQNFLGASDFVIFPYKDTRESASAAVTVGLSTLKPVLVTPLEIFSDLNDVTYCIGGHEGADIIRVIQDLLANPKELNALTNRQSDWVRSRSWDALSKRMLSVMHSLRREQELSRVIESADSNLKCNT
jgi:glycosyltransferase involved in cell wall biosynthesis